MAQAESKLSTWLEAEDAIAKGQSYTMKEGESETRLTRADLQYVSERITFWNGMIKRLQTSVRRRGRIIPG